VVCEEYIVGRKDILRYSLHLLKRTWESFMIITVWFKLEKPNKTRSQTETTYIILNKVKVFHNIRTLISVYEAWTAGMNRLHFHSNMIIF